MLRPLLDRLTGSVLAGLDMRDVQYGGSRWTAIGHPWFGRYPATIVFDSIHLDRVLDARRGS